MRNYITAVILGIAIGFTMASYISQLNPKQIEYITGETLTDTVKILVPYTEIIEKDPILIYKTKIDTIVIDSIHVIEVDQIVDTSAIIADFIKLRKYEKLLFDSINYGKLIVGADVQYNKLSKLSYSFEKYEPILETKKRKYIPFVHGTLGGNEFIGIGGGLFINNIGVSMGLVSDKSMRFNFIYKFE